MPSPVGTRVHSHKLHNRAYDTGAARPARVSASADRSEGGRHFGPNVVTAPYSRSALLEKYPQLHDALKPVTAARPPNGVQVSEHDGVRTVTINVHGFVPSGKDLTPGNESIAAMRDIAGYVKSIDADVVVLQELHQSDDATAGIPRQADVFLHMIDGNDMAFGGASHHHEVRNYELGNAVITRNGYRIDRAVVADLRNDDLKRGGLQFEDRAATIASIKSPNDGPSFTVMGSHLTSKMQYGRTSRDERTQDPESALHIQAAQYKQLADLVTDIRDDGRFSYRNSENGHRRSGTHFASNNVIVAGDFNAQLNTEEPGGISLNQMIAGPRTKLIASLDSLRRQGREQSRLAARLLDAGGIDHIFTNSDAKIGAVGRNDISWSIGAGRAADHPAVFSDIEFSSQ